MATTKVTRKGDTYYVVDPPKGWKYGFPKGIRKTDWHKEDFNIEEWLIKGGYPAKDVDFAVKYLRVWSQREV